MLITIILTVYGVLAVVAALLYIPKIKQFASMFYRPPHKIARQKRKISVVVPARSESKVIGDLFDSLLKQTYDRQYFDVNVIVDDENDPTVKLAKDIGANVFVVKNQKCKGDALDGYFKAIFGDKLNSYDAFVTVDADAVLTPDYLEELNNALEHDCQIFISRKYIKNYLGDKKSRSLYCNCSVLTYPQLDDMCNNYRTRKGIPLNMCGQGMLIRADVIKELGGWPYRTLTEDYELRMDCFLKGFTSMYYPYAVLYTEEVLTHKDSYVRRLRWVMGFAQCGIKYKKSIRKKARARGRLTEGEVELFYALAPVIVFISATILATLAGVVLTIFYAVTGGEWLRALLLLVVLPVAILYLITLVYDLLCMIAYRDALKPLSAGEKIAMLFYSPLFGLEFFPLYFHGRIRLHRGLEWKPTKRIVYAKGTAAQRAESERKNALRGEELTEERACD